MCGMLGERTYTADVQAEKEGRIYIFEIDGKKNHSTRRNKTRDKARDGALLGIGRRTIRIPTRWIIGRERFSDREILDEIEWQILTIEKTIGVENVAIPYPKSIEGVHTVALHLEHTQ